MQNTISHEYTTKVAAVRLARVVNALTFCELSRSSFRHHRETAYAHFQFKHSYWLMGGYLYEAFHLVNELAGNFGTAFHFKDLMQFAAAVSEYEHLLAEMNCNPSFTLDYGGGTTEQICETVWLDNAKLAKGRDGSNPRVPFYDEVTQVDAEWLRQRSKQYLEFPHLTDVLQNGLELYSRMFRMAAVKFIEVQILGKEARDMGLGE